MSVKGRALKLTCCMLQLLKHTISWGGLISRGFLSPQHLVAISFASTHAVTNDMQNWGVSPVRQCPDLHK